MHTNGLRFSEESLCSWCVYTTCIYRLSSMFAWKQIAATCNVTPLTAKASAFTNRRLNHGCCCCWATDAGVCCLGLAVCYARSRSSACWPVSVPDAFDACSYWLGFCAGERRRPRGGSVELLRAENRVHARRLFSYSAAQRSRTSRSSWCRSLSFCVRIISYQLTYVTAHRRAAAEAQLTDPLWLAVLKMRLCLSPQHLRSVCVIDKPWSQKGMRAFIFRSKNPLR